jgi:hypothetical protein
LHQYPGSGELARWILAGALSGAVSVVLFQQGLTRLLGILGFGELPLIWPLLVWGGVWGALLAASLGRLAGKRLILGAAAFGAVLPTLAALLLAAPRHGQPPVTGVVPLAILVTVVVNAAWGFGTGIGLALFGRR